MMIILTMMIMMTNEHHPIQNYAKFFVFDVIYVKYK